MDMINEIGRWLQEKEVLPTALERLGMADKLAEIVLISLGITVLLGILSCFFGLKLARFWSFLTVFVIGTGAAAAVAMQITSDETLSRDYSGNRVCNFEAGRNVCDCLCTWSSTKYILAPAGESDLAAGVCWNWSGICVVDD